MGALHDGHASLIRHAATTGMPCIVSIFVNPTQFNDPADFNRYPKTLEADLALCQNAGAAAVWVPAVDDIYPRGTSNVGTPPLPPVATLPGLEDSRRPGHFAGVLQVVHRLFELVRPTAAVFGEKDWQQLQLITQALGAPVGPRIIASPTLRECDGLAMSSRNRFLGVRDRGCATAISRALRACEGATIPEVAERIMRDALAQAGVIPEYAVVRDASTLLAPRTGEPSRALIAARVGTVRLIDNMPWR